MTMKDIRQTVGYNSINNYQDVLTVQTLLVQQGAKDLRVDGLYGPKTLKAIKEFQGRFLRSPDGVVSPGKKTLAYLNNLPQSLPKKSNTLPTQDNSNNSPIPLMPWQKGGSKQKGSVDNTTKNFIYPKTVAIEMLDAANPEGKDKQNLEIVLPLNQYFCIYGISNKKEIAHFLSQTAHESHLENTEEILDYPAKLMRKTFGCAGNKKGYDEKTDDCKLGHKRIRPMLWTEEKKYAHNPENLGNLVYNRKSMGNTKLGDGFKYRGRGIIQLTGKNNYKEFQRIHREHNPLDKQDFIKNPDLLIYSYQYAIEAAVIYWMHRKNLHTTAQTGTVEAVTNIVNNGLNGYRDRLKRFNQVAPLLGITEESK